MAVTTSSRTLESPAAWDALASVIRSNTSTLVLDARLRASDDGCPALHAVPYEQETWRDVWSFDPAANGWFSLLSIMPGRENNDLGVLARAMETWCFPYSGPTRWRQLDLTANPIDKPLTARDVLVWLYDGWSSAPEPDPRVTAMLGETYVSWRRFLRELPWNLLDDPWFQRFTLGGDTYEVPRGRIACLTMSPARIGGARMARVASVLVDRIVSLQTQQWVLVIGDAALRGELRSTIEKIVRCHDIPGRELHCDIVECSDLIVRETNPVFSRMRDLNRVRSSPGDGYELRILRKDRAHNRDQFDVIQHAVIVPLRRLELGRSEPSDDAPALVRSASKHSLVLGSHQPPFELPDEL